MKDQKKWGVTLSYMSLIFNVIIKLLYTPVLLRLLGQSEYGLYSLVLSIVGYLAVLDFGFGSTVTRYTVKYKSEGNRSKLVSLYGTLSVIYIAIGIIAFIICLILGFFSSNIFGNSMSGSEIMKTKVMLVLCGINLLFTFPLQISSSVLIAYEKFIFKNIINFAKIVIEPLLTIVLLSTFGMKSITAVMIITICNFFSYLLYYIYAVKKIDFHFSVKSFDKKIIRNLLAYSTSMFFLMVFEQLQFNSGQFILGISFGTKTIAIWGIVMIFVLNYRTISTSITNVFMPQFLQLVFHKDPSFFSVVLKMVRLQTIILCVILFNFILFGSYFINIWAGIEYTEAYSCSLIVMLPMTISLLFEFCYMYQMANNQLFYRIITFFFSFVISFLIIYLFFGLSLFSFAFILASSIILGQIFFVILFVYKSDIKYLFRPIILEIFKCIRYQIILTLFFYFFIQFEKSETLYNIYWFVANMVIYNVMLFLFIYYFAFNSQEKATINNFLFLNFRKYL